MRMDIVDTTKARRDLAEQDANEARQLVQAALDQRGDLYRQLGPEVLVSAADVYATLALRG